MKNYAHQQKIIDEDPIRCGLFLGTGSGKTSTALQLARGKTLVIAPKTQVEDHNWERQYVELMREGFTLHCRLTVISKETFRRDHEKLPHFDTVIGDEIHTMLGVTPNTRQRRKQQVPKASQLFEALALYLARTKPKRLYLCTATIIKTPFTVWAAGYILNPCADEHLMTSFYNFREKYYTKLPMPGRDVYVPKHDSATKDVLAAYVRSLGYVGRLEEFFDVPEQSFITKHIELTSKQVNRIKKLAIEFPDPIVLLGKQHQVENGVLAGDEFNAPEEFENGKIEEILDLALQFPRMVIFVKYTAQIKQIDYALTKAGYYTWIMDGQTKDRGEVIRQANELDGILIVQAQISAGWELPQTPVMVFASRTYSWVDYDQALGRVQRANHIKKNLYINLVVKDGVDEAVDRSLANKQDFNERIYLNV